MKSFFYLFACLGSLSAVTSLTVYPDPENPNGYVLLRPELEEVENQKLEVVQLSVSITRTLAQELVDAIVPGDSSNPAHVKIAEDTCPEALFDNITQGRHANYDYTSLLKAIGKFPAACSDESACKLTFATLFSHFAEDSSDVSDNTVERWRQSLQKVKQDDDGHLYRDGCDANNWKTTKFPCAQNKDYMGRGPLMLRYHDKYGALSQALYGDASVLLTNPELVEEPYVNFAAAIWFYLTTQPTRPSMYTFANRHETVETNRPLGFGGSINILKDDEECGSSNVDNEAAQRRVTHWQNLHQQFGYTQQNDEVDTCHEASPYTNVGIRLTHWAPDTLPNYDHPQNESFACMLASYETPYSILTPGDYENCVVDTYNVHPLWPAVRVVDEMSSSSSSSSSSTSTSTQSSTSTSNANVVGISSLILCALFLPRLAL